ncbi:MAG: cation transporter [Geminicoccaceae bacterium]|nr:cation transporter [Geminicoccaceae bacterium]
MSHDHGHEGHGHSHDTGGMSDARLWWAVAVNVGLTVAQIVGGIVAGSLALIADALHNLNDAATLALALFARKVGRKPADKAMTFGYGRAEVIAALINLTTLIIVGLYLAYEAVARFFQPEPIDGWIVVVVAGVALAVDVVTAFLTYAGSKDSINIKAAFVHNVSDAAASVGVIVAGTLILLYDLYIADLIVTLIISAYVLWQGVTLMPRTIRILMGATPSEIDFDEVMAAMRGVPGVRGVHHLHVWELDERRRSLEAHVVIGRGDAPELERIKGDVRGRLGAFDIGHCTLEIEFADAPCHDRGPAVLGGA